MNNEAIERDEALEETTKINRPYDPDKMIQISVFISERVKRALMQAGSARRMSMGKYAGLLLNRAVDPSFNAPPKKAHPLRRKGLTA